MVLIQEQDAEYSVAPRQHQGLALPKCKTSQDARVTPAQAAPPQCWLQAPSTGAQQTEGMQVAEPTNNPNQTIKQYPESPLRNKSWRGQKETALIRHNTMQPTGQITYPKCWCRRGYRNIHSRAQAKTNPPNRRLNWAVGAEDVGWRPQVRLIKAVRT